MSNIWRKPELTIALIKIKRLKKMKNKFYLLICGIFVLFTLSNCSRTNADKFANQNKVEPASSSATKRAVSGDQLSPEVKAIRDRKIQNSGIMLKKGMKIEQKKKDPKKDN